MKLGFSTGCLWRDMDVKQALEAIRAAGCNAVELGFIRFENMQKPWLDGLSSEDFEGFEHVSFHAPKITYGKNKETEYVFDQLRTLNKIRPLDCIVIHPDIVEDFTIFQNTELPFAFENMDNRKKAFQTPEELDELTRKYGFKRFVLDVNHVFTNDPTMKSTKQFYDLLGDRIVEIQVSGYETLHDPLAVTKQAIIVEAIQGGDIPIIDEAGMPPNLLKAERDFILEHLG